MLAYAMLSILYNPWHESDSKLQGNLASLVNTAKEGEGVAQFLPDSLLSRAALGQESGHPGADKAGGGTTAAAGEAKEGATGAKGSAAPGGGGACGKSAGRSRAKARVAKASVDG
eukprot:9151292-Alexandrium_andersonii.AAC.1